MEGGPDRGDLGHMFHDRGHVPEAGWVVVYRHARPQASAPAGDGEAAIPQTETRSIVTTNSQKIRGKP